ncbi:NADH-quinone oxidoreductase subunit L [Halapricum hydrolyticum]|uniref:NADH-quinone oxidoreductase subunit L n=1 Tax=Halapricum hydrolyticum TaxID=2979991 RepID=A0AAE3LDZ2_9EURY|nr:NADH-quinone oxidoreductase subunit L [Halapricum hydrolyticum]MCU4716634.1 NADH-quinone oxidoreductase subunit L [Halapricum hydrolyticum]MCU4725761.1 NADH-quinone oxidoreductase subunit L [Halapricum hydrolyticum]
MTWIYDLVPAIALLPLVSFVVALFAGKYLPKKGALAGIAATGGSLVLSLLVALTVATSDGADTGYNETLYTFLEGSSSAPFSLELGVLIDPLSALMLVVVSLISFLVHVFSLGYMNDEGETGLPRYYAGLGLFSFSMLAFVFASNILMAFMFFELVGLCSYLLIGFWFREAGPPSAAKKAFLVTRFGDYFFLVGVVAIFATFGTGAFAGSESFPHLAEQALHGEHSVNTFLGLGEQAWFTVVGLLVLGGVIGKSAQFPLHTWLPDAMEGPTPVSALIHAATMVAAGVFLVARMYGFYALSPTALGVIAFIGGFTALFAATMGVVKQELKQVLAYSTISQYGYMMLALGGGGYVAAVFHLTTHAVFKALLFLGAGSVIIAMHHNENMWDMGGLKEKMPVTYWTFLAGSLALAGIFPFAGFWSKDEVLYETLIHGLGESPLLLGGYAMGLLAVVFTGFYTFRMVFLTFHGEPRTDVAEDPEPVRWNVKGPLVVLGVLATVLGAINMVPIKKLTDADIDFLHQFLDEAPSGFLTSVHHYAELLEVEAGYGAADIGTTGLLASAALSLGLALAGAGLAYRLYNVPEPVEHTDKLGRVKTLLMHNYYQDEYQVWLATGLTVPVAKAADTFDQGIIDGVVNGISSVSRFAGRGVRRIQTGVVRNYAALLTLALVLLVAFFGVTGGWF